MHIHVLPVQARRSRRVTPPTQARNSLCRFAGLRSNDEFGHHGAMMLICLYQSAKIVVSKRFSHSGRRSPGRPIEARQAIGRFKWCGDISGMLSLGKIVPGSWGYKPAPSVYDSSSQGSVQNEYRIEGWLRVRTGNGTKGSPQVIVNNAGA